MHTAPTAVTVVLVGLVGCGSTTPAPPLSETQAPDRPAPDSKPWIGRRLTIGSGTASRSTWVLTLDGNQATLVATFEQTDDPLAIERIDEAAWKVTETRGEKGPVRHVGDHLALDLESPNDSLFLHCWKRSIAVATAGAKRVARPGHLGDCSDNGTWSPPEMMHVDALICGQGNGLDDGQQSGIDGQLDPLDETLFRFAVSPGIELVQVSDGCFSSTGLRLAAVAAGTTADTR